MALRGLRKTRQGIVISDKMDKTISVEMDYKMKHPLYGKVIHKRAKLYAHDENNEAGTGDKVMVMETRPFSKMKRWRLVKILEKAK
ncbi:MAG: 30S ribosomal protein S17 [candidate division Zixibacteria bacterium]|nr:30S ribosomal protein S17 [candidate division Zixibacteria bacterium]